MLPPNNNYFPTNNNGGHYYANYPTNNLYVNEQLARFKMAQQQWEERQWMVLNQLSMAHANKMFPQVYQIIETQQFAKEHHDKLQKLWYNCHYEEAKSNGKDSLSPVSRYRIRKKFPLPSTIWDGEEISYCFKEKSRKMLQVIFENSPYPTGEEKKQLSTKTGLTSSQISNWFKNRRQRQRLLRHNVSVKTEPEVGKFTKDGSVLENTARHSSSSVDIDYDQQVDIPIFPMNPTMNPNPSIDLSNFFNPYSYQNYQPTPAYQMTQTHLNNYCQFSANQNYYNGYP